MSDLKQAFESIGVNEIEVAKQTIIKQQETIRELEFDCAMLQRQLSDMGHKFAKLTNRPFKKPFVKRSEARS
jgi:hypothetical protein|tara:strand:+ start:6893 stop:7108 length:216 start_codon:yes stop_codon:yes gene_type:complete